MQLAMKDKTSNLLRQAFAVADLVEEYERRVTLTKILLGLEEVPPSIRRYNLKKHLEGQLEVLQEAIGTLQSLLRREEQEIEEL